MTAETETGHSGLNSWWNMMMMMMMMSKFSISLFNWLLKNAMEKGTTILKYWLIMLKEQFIPWKSYNSAWRSYFGRGL
jgi:hypothetical protein